MRTTMPSRLGGCLALLAIISCSNAGGTAGGSAGGAGSQAPAGGHAPIRPTPRPSFDGTTLGTTPRADILAYAHSLKFRSDFMAGDGQPVGIVNGKAGPYVRVAAEIGSRSITRDSMAKGLILAVVGASAGYSRIGVAPGRNYLWIDSVGTGKWRFVMISEIPNLLMHSFPGLLIDKLHDPAFEVQSEARIYAEGTDPETLWITCETGCCVPCPSDGPLYDIMSDVAGSIPNGSTIKRESVVRDTCPQFMAQQSPIMGIDDIMKGITLPGSGRGPKVPPKP